MSTATAHTLPPPWTRATPQVARIAAYVVAVIGFGAFARGIPIFIVSGDAPWILPIVAFLAVGTVILHRWPAHPVGWLFLWLGALSGVSGGAMASVLPVALAVGDPPVPADSVPTSTLVLSLAAEALNTAVTAVLVPLSLLLFPDGRLPSRRWRWLPWLAMATGVVGATAAALNGGWGGDPLQAVVLSPTSGTPGATLFTTLFYPMLAVAWVGAAVSIVIRFRRASGTERAQLKLLASAAVYAIVAIVATQFTGAGRTSGGLQTFLVALAMAAAPAAAGVAILRYRMFDIDIVIRRSLVVGGLVAFVTGLYVAIVVGLGRALGTRGEADPLLAVAATAVVAVAFQPARDWLTRLANRIVYGHRATPYEVLVTFAREVAGSADPDALLARAAESLAAGSGAVEAAVWVRVGDRLQPAARHPHGEEAGEAVVAVDLASDELPALPADLAVEVRHDGSLLGAVTLRKPRGEPPTAADAALAQRLADQIGVALTNIRLTAELRARAEELEASRRRMLTAADDERRALERRLSERAGQRLLALGTGLALVERDASGAPRAREQLATLQVAVRDAVEDLGRLGRGLYPPLLQAEGLAAALQAAANRSAMAVQVSTGGVARLPQAHEAAIYFCVLEALGNAEKHADSASARVTVVREDDRVAFTIADAGRGFDQASGGRGTGLDNLRDRLAALGGTLEIQSAPGAGTRVVGTIPLPEEEAAP